MCDVQCGAVPGDAERGDVDQQMTCRRIGGPAASRDQHEPGGKQRKRVPIPTPASAAIVTSGTFSLPCADAGAVTIGT
jgi:hypothetical protein